MFGFLLGSLCLAALVGMLVRGGRFGRCGGYGRGWGHHGRHRGWGGGEGWGRGSFMKQAFLRHAFERLDTTPGQEKVVAQAFDDAFGAVKDAREELARTRQDVARAVGGQSFDETVLGEAFARQDDAVRTVRLALTGALGRVHGSLDDRQRTLLAEMIAEGPVGFRGPRHPYRG